MATVRCQAKTARGRCGAPATARLRDLLCQSHLRTYTREDGLCREEALRICKEAGVSCVPIPEWALALARAYGDRAISSFGRALIVAAAKKLNKSEQARRALKAARSLGGVEAEKLAIRTIIVEFNER